jgi:hypothetical protein
MYRLPQEALAKSRSVIRRAVKALVLKRPRLHPFYPGLDADAPGLLVGDFPEGFPPRHFFQVFR